MRTTQKYNRGDKVYMGDRLVTLGRARWNYEYSEWEYVAIGWMG
jgi:hypothetical protein